MTITAFQIGAFQFTGFQEGIAVGSGGKRRFILAQALARRRIKESPTPAEVAAILTEARARLDFRTAPYVTTDLAPLMAEMRAKEDRRELDEFMAFVEQLLAEEME